MEKNNTNLTEAMVFDTEISIEEKERLWNDIFLFNPDLSNMIIKLYKEFGTEGLIKLSSIFEQIADLTKSKNKVEQ